VHSTDELYAASGLGGVRLMLMPGVVYTADARGPFTLGVGTDLVCPVPPVARDASGKLIARGVPQCVLTGHADVPIRDGTDSWSAALRLGAGNHVENVTFTGATGASAALVDLVAPGAAGYEATFRGCLFQDSSAVGITFAASSSDQDGTRGHG